MFGHCRELQHRVDSTTSHNAIVSQHRELQHYRDLHRHNVGVICNATTICSATSCHAHWYVVLQVTTSSRFAAPHSSHCLLPSPRSSRTSHNTMVVVSCPPSLRSTRALYSVVASTATSVTSLASDMSSNVRWTFVRPTSYVMWQPKWRHVIYRHTSYHVAFWRINMLSNVRPTFVWLSSSLHLTFVIIIHSCHRTIFSNCTLC
jgi:hypothetical protein